MDYFNGFYFVLKNANRGEYKQQAGWRIITDRSEVSIFLKYRHMNMLLPNFISAYNVTKQKTLKHKQGRANTVVYKVMWCCLFAPSAGELHAPLTFFLSSSWSSWIPVFPSVLSKNLFQRFLKYFFSLVNTMTFSAHSGCLHVLKFHWSRSVTFLTTSGRYYTTSLMQFHVLTIAVISLSIYIKV